MAPGRRPGVTLADTYRITASAAGQKSTIIFDDFDSGLIVKSFIFALDLKVGDGTASPADGFSINYCRAEDPVVTQHDGNGWAASPGAEANLPEEGTQTGIGIGFDAWNSGSGDIIGISVRVDNVLLTQIPMPTLNGAATDATSLQTGPRTSGTGVGDQLTWQPLKIEVKDDAKVNIWWKNVQIVTNLQTTYFPSAGRIVFGGRTGDAYQLTEVDNISIQTFASASPLIGTINGEVDGFSFMLVDAASATVVPNQVTAMWDGAAVTLTALPKSGTTNTFVYHTFPTLMPPGSNHKLDIFYKDSNNVTTESTNHDVTIPAYSVVAAKDTVPTASVNTALPGFVANVVQAESVSTLANSSQRAEKQLRGQLLDANLQPYQNKVTATMPVSIPGIINWNYVWNTAEIGSLMSPDFPDAAIPGVDGTTIANTAIAFDNIAAEITTFLDLKKGVYRLAVNSDDGFRVTFGNQVKDVLNPNIGLYEGGKGASDVVFSMAVMDDGMYPVRILWYQGNGGANLEFFAIQADGRKVPVNNVADSTGDQGVSSVVGAGAAVCADGGTVAGCDGSEPWGDAECADRGRGDSGGGCEHSVVCEWQ